MILSHFYFTALHFECRTCILVVWYCNFYLLKWFGYVCYHCWRGESGQFCGQSVTVGKTSVQTWSTKKLFFVFALQLLPANSDSFRLPFLSLGSSGVSYWQMSTDNDTSERETWRKRFNLLFCAFFFFFIWYKNYLVLTSPLWSTSRTGGCSSSSSGTTFIQPQMLEKAVKFSWFRFIVSTTDSNSRDYRDQTINVKVISCIIISFGICNFWLPLPPSVTLYQSSHECLHTPECPWCSCQEGFHKTRSAWNRFKKHK